MKMIVRWLVVMGIVLQLLAQVAYAGKADSNARQAADYISQLRAGANPNTLKRPQLRHLRGYSARQLNNHLTKAMDDAEALARAGKQDRIILIEVVDDDSSKGK